MRPQPSRNADQPVLAALDGDDCRWCATGTVVRQEFQGDEAVVCENCGTPAARVW